MTNVVQPYVLTTSNIIFLKISITSLVFLYRTKDLSTFDITAIKNLCN